MEKKDIQQLATLARIATTDDEAESLAKDITSILQYVSEIEKITGSNTEEKKVSELFNVMREDGTPHKAGMYTEDLLAQAPERSGEYIQVKKIVGGGK